ncbi:uncharacterized protein LOC135204500 isoform X1 [Macrobrachium nipponense]|uniref:uncharacterized protein LOC135204500 isoform X1 n=1 Tax=Macrobrachium nipponense TaxID=159736 RepID=UPI0030C80AB3
MQEKQEQVEGKLQEMQEKLQHVEINLQEFHHELEHMKGAVNSNQDSLQNILAKVETLEGIHRETKGCLGREDLGTLQEHIISWTSRAGIFPSPGNIWSYLFVGDWRNR